MAYWIAVDTTISRNVKVIRLARTLGIDRAKAVGHLITLWANVMEQREDGDISKWTGLDVEDYAGWEGEKEAFFNAVTSDESRFIDQRDGMLIIHDWLDRASTFLIKRYQSTPAGKQKLIEIWAKHGRTYGASHDAEQPGEPGKPPKPTKVAKTFADDSIQIILAKHLWEYIRQRDTGQQEPNFQSWAKSIDEIIRLNKRAPDEIRAVIDFAQNHPIQSNGFTWKDNIRSTSKLREQYPKLLEQMRNDKNRSEKGSDSGYGKGNRSYTRPNESQVPSLAENPAGESY